MVLPYLNRDQCTWTSTDERTHNQIKYVLWKEKVSIPDVRYFRGAACHNDHYLWVAYDWETLSVSTVLEGNIANEGDMAFAKWCDMCDDRWYM